MTLISLLITLFLLIGCSPFNDAVKPLPEPVKTVALSLSATPFPSSHVPQLSVTPFQPAPLTYIPIEPDKAVVSTVIHEFAENRGTGDTHGLAVGPDGNLYVSDNGHYQILKITPDGQLSPFAGDGKQGSTDGSASQARFLSPRHLIFDSQGNLYVNDGFTIRKITPDQTVTTVAGQVDCCSPGGGPTVGYEKAGQFVDGKGTDARFLNISGMGIDSTNRLYVIDSDNNASRIRQIHPDGTVITLAGGKRGFADGPAASAQLGFAWYMTVTPTGDVYFYDSERIRRLSPEGIVSTFIAGCRVVSGGCLYHRGSGDGSLSSVQFLEFRQIKSDKRGNLYIAENRSSGVTYLRQISPNGMVKTLLDPTGKTTSSILDSSQDGLLKEVFVGFSTWTLDERSGDIYVLSGQRIRRISMHPIPVIRSLEPSSGKRGDTVTLRGMNLKETKQILFNKNPASFEIIDEQTVKAIVPQTVSVFKAPVEILTPYGQNSLSPGFVVDEPTAVLATRNPYTVPITITIRASSKDPKTSPKVFVFKSKYHEFKRSEEFANAEVEMFDPGQPGSLAAHVPDPVGNRHVPEPESWESLIGFNDHIPSRVVTGQFSIEPKVPLQEILSRYNAHQVCSATNDQMDCSPSFSGFYRIIPDMTRVDLAKLEDNIRLINAVTTDPKFIITSLTFNHMEAAKTFAFMMELSAQDLVESIGFNPILSID